MQNINFKIEFAVTRLKFSVKKATFYNQLKKYTFLQMHTPNYKLCRDVATLYT